MRFWLAFIGFVCALVWALGCAPTGPSQPCFEPIAINPLTGTAITFNRCDGSYQVYRDPNATTTTTTLPKVPL